MQALPKKINDLMIVFKKERTFQRGKTEMEMLLEKISIAMSIIYICNLLFFLYSGVSIGNYSEIKQDEIPNIMRILNLLFYMIGAFSGFKFICSVKEKAPLSESICLCIITIIVMAFPFINH